MRRAWRRFHLWLRGVMADPWCCQGCGRPIADRWSDRLMWRRHVSLIGEPDHDIDACDGTPQHSPITIPCRYDCYPSDGSEDH